MKVDWNVASNILAPIIALFVGVAVDRWFRDRSKLITFYGHVAAFKVRLTEAPALDVFTHSVVIHNAGRKAATNVRVSHQLFPLNVTVFPPIEYSETDLPDGGKDIVIPTLVPGQQITISYLYYPPLTWDKVTTGVRCDQGLAKVLNVLPSVQQPRWIRNSIVGLSAVGAAAVLYAAYELARWLSP